MKKWLIFDAMGVVFEAGVDIRDLLIPFIENKKPVTDVKLIFDLYMKASLGKISSKDFWQALGFKDWQKTEKDYLDNCLTLDKDFVKTAEQLLQSYNLAMLSNDVSEWSAYLRRKFDLDRLFKVVVISGDVGSRKPDKRIYDILLQQINAPAERCVFIDDRVKNLITASELGIKPVLFNRDRIDPEGFVSAGSFAEILEVLL